MTNIQDNISIDFPRRKTKPVFVGDVQVGGGAPISVQSMTKTFTHDVKATVNQIQSLARAGCQIIRSAVPEEKDAIALREIVKESPIPLIADIHYDPRLAMIAIEAGVQGLRLNPGNIRNPEKVGEIARAAGERNIPIRIGVNAGSISKEMRDKVEAGELSLPEAMVESAVGHIRLLEDNGFNHIKVALKAHDVSTTLLAHRLMAEQCDYPFHCGITEAGPPRHGAIKSAVGLTLLISEGLADTVRVSLTADPVEEVHLAISVLESLGLREPRLKIISCPTCGRREIDVAQWMDRVEKVLLDQGISDVSVAVMGCVVNGPGEARAADLGITGSGGKAVVFRHGEVISTVPEEQVMDVFMKELNALIEEKEKGEG
jgi:(E)-4-hydroxy-3-methylbut-2-enyl-diphosphate synthase